MRASFVLARPRLEVMERKEVGYKSRVSELTRKLQEREDEVKLLRAKLDELGFDSSRLKREIEKKSTNSKTTKNM